MTRLASPPAAPAHERGSASLLVLAAAAFAVALAAAVALLGTGLRAGARARTAADLAALAAADVLGDPAATGEPCAGAAAVAARNGARLVSCDAGADGVTVVAETRFLARPIRASARAEPGAYGDALAAAFARALATALAAAAPARVARPPPGYDLRRTPRRSPVRCASCSSTVSDGRRFCPSCGTPVAVPAGARAGAAARATSRPDTAEPAGAAAGTSGEPATAALAMPADGPYDQRYDYDEEEVVAREERTTQLLEPVGAPEPAAAHGGRTADAGAALGRAGDAVRHHAGRAARRFGAAPAEVRLAMVGTALTLLSFLALPYGDGTGTAADHGARLWWRPVAAIVATVLLATTLRARGANGADGSNAATAATAAAGPDGTATPHVRAGGAVDRLLAALVVATVGATEAGLVGLFSGDTARARVGFYGMLLGLAAVLVAAVKAARRRCAA